MLKKFCFMNLGYCRFVPIDIDQNVANIYNIPIDQAMDIRGRYEEANPDIDFNSTQISDEEKYGNGGYKILNYWTEKLRQRNQNKIASIQGHKKVSYANAYNSMLERYDTLQLSVLTDIMTRVMLSYSAFLNEYNDALKDKHLENLVQKYRGEVDKESIKRFIDVDIERAEKNEVMKNYLDVYYLAKGLHEGKINADTFMRQIIDIMQVHLDALLNTDISSVTYDAIKKIKDNKYVDLGKLAWIAKDTIFHRTGIDIGKSKAFVTLEEVEEESFDEEKMKDDNSYSKDKDSRDLKATKSTSTRIVLACLPVVTSYNGVNSKFKTDRSILGDNRTTYWNEDVLHSNLTTLLADCSSIEDMLARLRSSGNASFLYLADAIEMSDDLKQTFFKDFLSYTQSYRTFSIQNFKNSATKFFRNLISGSYKNYSVANYFKNIIKSAQTRKNPLSIFIVPNGEITDNTVSINNNNWKNFTTFINNNLRKTADNIVFKESDSNTTLEEDRFMFLNTALNDFLNMNVSKRVIETLSKQDPVLFKHIIKELYYMMKSETLNNERTTRNFTTTVKGDVQGFKNLLSIINRADNKYTTKIRHNKSDLNKQGMPSEVGMLFNNIRSIITRAETSPDQAVEDLHNFLKAQYLDSSEYMCTVNGENVILIDWLNKLYNTRAEDFENPNSFVNLFANSWGRILALKNGYQETNTDRMNETQNLLTAIYSFFGISDVEASELDVVDAYAEYISPTMGDSRTIRTITAPKYSMGELRTHFGNIVRQEINRMYLEKAFKEKVEKDGSIVKEGPHDSKYNIDTNNVTACGKNADEKHLGEFVYLKILNNYKADLEATLEQSGIDAVVEEAVNILFDEKAGLYKEAEEEFFNVLKEKYPGIFKTKTIISEDTKTTVFELLPFLKVKSLDENNMPLWEDVKNDITSYYLNSKLANIYQFQLYKKNIGAYVDGKGNISSIPAQKRLKAINTPGTRLNVNAKLGNEQVGRTEEKCIYFKEFKKSLLDTNPKLLTTIIRDQIKEAEKRFGITLDTIPLNAKRDAIEKWLKEHEGIAAYDNVITTIKEYLKTNSTDGQGYRTINSYRRVCIMAKMWSDDQEAAYQTIDKLRKEYAKAVKNERDKEAALIVDQINDACTNLYNPLKPHLSGAEKITLNYTDAEGHDKTDVLYIPVEHKYAEAILIPEFYKEGSLMHTLGTYMEDNDIDLACSEECVKVGNWGTVDLQHYTDEYNNYPDEKNKELISADKVGNVADYIRGKLQNSIIHTMDYNDYEIQNNYPQHTDTDQLVGTQIRKQIFSTLMAEGNAELFCTSTGGVFKEFKFNGEVFDLSDRVNGNRNLLTLYNLLVSKGFLDSFLDSISNISDSYKLSELLSDYKRRDDRSTPLSITKFATKNGRFIVPIAECSTRYEVESYLTSNFKDKVQRQKMKGESLIQISDLGFDLKTHFDKKGNPTYDECAVVWDCSVIINGKKTELKFSDYCHADGTLIESDYHRQARLAVESFDAISNSLNELGIKLTSEQILNYLNDNAELPAGTVSLEDAIKIVDNLKVSKNIKNALKDTFNGLDKPVTLKQLFDEIIIHNSALVKFKGVIKSIEDFDEAIPYSKLEYEYPGSLDRIAYRIPTERMYSACNLKVARFLPKCFGGVIAVPSHLVTASGFDFDIDKLYVLKREYNVREEYEEFYDKQDVAAAWEAIYKDSRYHNEKGVLAIDALKDARTVRVRRLASILRATGFFKENDDILPTEEEALITYYNKNRKKIESYIEQSSEPTFEIPKHELYNYWEDAGLQGTYHEAFLNYISENPNKIKRTENTKQHLVKSNYNKDVASWKDADINNMIIDIMKNRMEDPNSVNARYTPGGFNAAKKASNILKVIIYGKTDEQGHKITTIEKAKEWISKNPNDDIEPSYDLTNPITTAIYNSRNIIAKQVIGIFANHNTHYAYTKFLEKAILTKPVKLFGKEAADLIHSNGSQFEDASLNLAELLAASVDAVKNPVLNFLNINSYTANVAALLSRLGYSSLEVGIFLNQPIIKEICQFMSDNGMSNLSSACRQIAKKHNQEKNNAIVELDAKTLEKNLTATDNNVQMSVLNTFMDLAVQAQALSDFIDCTKYTASNTLGNLFSDVIALQFKEESAMSKSRNEMYDNISIETSKNSRDQNLIRKDFFAGKVSKIRAMQDYKNYLSWLIQSPMAYEQVMYDSIQGLLEALSVHFPYKTQLYSHLYEVMSNLCLYGDLDNEIVELLHNTIPLYVLQSEEGSLLNPDTIVIDPITNNEYTSRKYYVEEFPKQMIEILDIVQDFQEKINTLRALDAIISTNPSNELKGTYDLLVQEVKNIAENQLIKTSLGKNLFSHDGEVDYERLQSFAENSLIGSLDYELSYRREFDGMATVTINQYKWLLNSNGHFDKNRKTELTDAWRQLAVYFPNIAKSIALTNFFNGGFNISYSNFNNIMPVEVLEMLDTGPASNYLDKIANMPNTIDSTFGNNRDIKFGLNQFIKLLYIFNHDNAKLVRPLRSVNEKGFDRAVIELDDSNNTKVTATYNKDGRTLSVNCTDLLKSDFVIPGSIEKRKDNIYCNVVPAVRFTGSDGVTHLFILESDNIYDNRVNVSFKSKTLTYREYTIPEQGDVGSFSKNNANVTTGSYSDSEVLNSVSIERHSNTYSANRASYNDLLHGGILNQQQKTLENNIEDLKKKNNVC